ncbi:MAG: cation:proton antiporter [Phototrophicales bacterium]|nr:MAG: cation:proton antiporter [Phototrophicales bacterium]
MDFFFALALGILFGTGVFQLLRRDLIKAAMGTAILFTSINLFFLASGAFAPDVPAYVDQYADGKATPSDPLVQAMILTAVVVSFGSYALLLSIITAISTRYDTLNSDEVDELKN